jgi:uncharacterized paraquat-inducible protein A
MENLSHQRCFRHQEREAVARCPECRRYFCRECITEHDDRVVCATCLKKLTVTGVRSASRWRLVRNSLHGLLAVLVLWLVFYSLGRCLLSIPSSFHEGTVWKEFQEDEP